MQAYTFDILQTVSGNDPKVDSQVVPTIFNLSYDFNSSK